MRLNLRQSLYRHLGTIEDKVRSVIANGVAMGIAIHSPAELAVIPYSIYSLGEIGQTLGKYDVDRETAYKPNFVEHVGRWSRAAVPSAVSAYVYLGDGDVIKTFAGAAIAVGTGYLTELIGRKFRRNVHQFT